MLVRLQKRKLIKISLKCLKERKPVKERFCLRGANRVKRCFPKRGGKSAGPNSKRAANADA